MIPWSSAWQEALYGADGFFLRSAPADHFRTNVAVPLFAEAVRRLAAHVDSQLGHPDPFDLVDVGTGRGELLSALVDVPARWRLQGVELSGPFLRSVPAVHGLLLANEWLDSLPVDVLEDGREVLVDGCGVESLGAPVASDWVDRWWPFGARVEVGARRDAAWVAAVGQVSRGLAVAVDYGHLIAERRPTLTGYRDGRQVPPVPDGSCDLTAHVAWEPLLAATDGILLTQHEALTRLGLSAGLPRADDPAYAVGLERASQARELLDPDGLGGFGWLLCPVGVDVDWMSG